MFYHRVHVSKPPSLQRCPWSLGVVDMGAIYFCTRQNGTPREEGGRQDGGQ